MNKGTTLLDSAANKYGSGVRKRPLKKPAGKTKRSPKKPVGKTKLKISKRAGKVALPQGKKQFETEAWIKRL